MLITNSVYDKDRMGMSSLPAAKNDHQTMKSTITKLMDIPESNVFEIAEGTKEQLDKKINLLSMNA